MKCDVVIIEADPVEPFFAYKLITKKRKSVTAP